MTVHLSERETAVTDLYASLHPYAAADFAERCLLPRFLRHLEWLGIQPDALRGRSFLDAGCGGFAGGAAIAVALDAAEILGVDLSAANVGEARRRFALFPRVRFQRDNLLGLSLPSNRFDFVYSTGVLHHTEHPEGGFRELVRVLKPGGRIYIGVYGKGGLYNGAVVPAAKLAGRVVPRTVAMRVARRVPRLLRPSSSLLDLMYVPIEVHYRREEIEDWFRRAAMDPVFLRHPEQPATWRNRILFGQGSMLYFSAIKSPD